MLTDRELILLGWVQEESVRVGRELVEGFDYDVYRDRDALYIIYYTDPDRDHTQIFEVTDNPILH